MSKSRSKRRNNHKKSHHHHHQIHHQHQQYQPSHSIAEESKNTGVTGFIWDHKLISLIIVGIYLILLYLFTLPVSVISGVMFFGWIYFTLSSSSERIKRENKLRKLEEEQRYFESQPRSYRNEYDKLRAQYEFNEKYRDDN